jgi:GT2 family glycosyltransferase
VVVLLRQKVCPIVSIIILNYNGNNLSSECLQSVLDNTDYPSCELLLADNGSTDDSVEKVKKNLQKLII